MLVMKDYLENWDKLDTHATGCALIRDLATDPEKRALFDQLAQHLNQLADEVGRASRKKLGRLASN